MVVKRINLKNFRCHKDITIELNPNVTIITGKNGSGKTSILEAIYIVCRGKSFKGSLKDSINTKSDWWNIKTYIDDEETKSSIKKEKENFIKQFTINETKFKSLPNKYKKPIVLFEPEDMRIINGSPTRRRDYIDNLISQYDLKYGLYLNKYNKLLKQRNYLLKKPNTKRDDFFAWNLSLSEYGSYIVKQRVKLIKQLNENIKPIYKRLSDNHDEVSFQYSESESENTQQKLFNKLEKNITKDKIIGSTSIGPHRHDVFFYINNKEAKATASRGENRTTILALKFFEIELVEKNTGKKPIILLDDVYSELDSIRQKKLNNFTTDHQVVITSVNMLNLNKNQNSVVL